MTNVLEPEARFSSQAQTSNASQRIRQSFTACRLKFKWIGTTRSLNSDQKTQAAESFGAEGTSISAGKRLIDTKHEAYRNLTSLRSQITRYWKDNSLAFPEETGVRLIKQDRISEFDSAFRRYRSELNDAVRQLDVHFSDLKEAARLRLGALYDDSDYPTSLEGEIEMNWEFPNLEVPSYLRQLNPAVYAEQSRKVTERFERSVEIAEQAFIEQLDGLVNHLAERISSSEDGRPKIFRDSAVQNFKEFFDRFRSLNVSSNEQLDELVARCEQMVSGVQPQQLRDNESLRRSLATNLSTVQSSLDQMLVDRPRRNILRPKRRQEG